MAWFDQALRDQVLHTAVRLPYAVDAQQFSAHRLPAVFLDEAWPTNDVDCPVFIFQRDKDHTVAVLGRCRTVTMPLARAS